MKTRKVVHLLLKFAIPSSTALLILVRYSSLSEKPAPSHLNVPHPSRKRCMLMTNLSEGRSLAYSVNRALDGSRPTVGAKIAQVSPLYGCWRLTYQAGGIVHQSTLWMNGYNGTMRTNYWSPFSSRAETVEQRMGLVSSASGLIIAGSNPVWAGTSVRATFYSPDHFLFAIQPNGRYTAMTCDERLSCSPVIVKSCS
jgi:hypothetical protein